jgi:hypothetical protein
MLYQDMEMHDVPLLSIGNFLLGRSVANEAAHIQSIPDGVKRMIENLKLGVTVAGCRIQGRVIDDCSNDEVGRLDDGGHLFGFRNVSMIVSVPEKSVNCNSFKNVDPRTMKMGISAMHTHCNITSCAPPN